ncbi:PREDICTED: lipase member H-A isoform X1 [Bactrocera latifrons]|uniref:Lipase member H-A n=3 Tax=Bactrocera latifrons TaxID=174628 RepID=A0A0K8UL76_BACLA|nr:PREDICTED: lipase member H-A isoform X1 [Bactrocera latifrons]XP_018795055.1 PREDICTED: lipase member H-A isoform X1 [Bactrocera latifrons]XP_018795056.1 PREDICTED: lipase member H-A isoform X1 [Bactrocera latifrons]XP_018795057.1 PREDICTED: lipase member H-A isoform X1 [Bactrocera latifrons]XP_018795059.1 PREDICTED: lipase member H-A isoform X1 [Bactrocera latifrons]
MFKAVKIKSRLLMGLKTSHADLTIAKFILFYGPTFADSNIFNIDDYKSMLEDSNFSKTKNTVLYIHGYLEDADIESVHVIVDAYLQRNDVNLIVLDWGELANGNYMFDAVVNCKQLASVLARNLIAMFEMGLDIDKFHIVGHSLGGQMAGIIGREVYRRNGKTKKLPRLSALDPAFPLFYGTFSYHLSKHDAEFVDVIHTDAWIYGAPVSTGTADFWPNGGTTLQPGCPKRNYKLLSDNDLSSHRRSWWFWAESVKKEFPCHFYAVKAKNWGDFKNGKYVDNEEQRVVMGHDCPTNITGDYYLQTNGIQPYARDMAGITYVHPAKLVGNSTTESDDVEPSKT